MRKLKLSLDDLRVDSFHAVAHPADAGTVVGHTGKSYCESDSVCDTCPLSCAGSCQSCYDTCLFTCEDSCQCSGNVSACGGCQTWETCAVVDVCGNV